MIEIRPKQQTAMGVGKKRSPPSVSADDVPVGKKPQYKYWDIAALPVEVVGKILSYQSFRDISACRLVSRHWKGLIDDFHLQARSFYRRCYPDVPFLHDQEIADGDYQATCRWLRHFTWGSRSVEQLDLLRARANTYFCQELCCAIGAGFAQAKLNQPRQIYTTSHPRRVGYFDFSASGNAIVSISQQYLQSLDLSVCRATISIDGNIHGQWQLQKWIVHPGHVHSFGFSPDENDFMAVFHHPAARVKSYSVFVWHSNNGNWQQHFQMDYSEEDDVAMVSFTPCGQYLLIASVNLEIYHRTGDRWRKQDSIPMVQPADHLVFSADQRHLLVTCSNDAFRLFHRIGERWQAQGIVGECDPYTRPVFSPDGCRFAVIHQGIVTIWAYQQESWEPQRCIEGSGRVRGLCFHGQNRFVICYSNASPEILEVVDSAPANRIQFPCCAAANIRISPDNKHFAWYYYNTVIIWALVGGRLQERGKLEHSGTVLSICFSPDGQLLATASADKTTKIIRRVGAIWWQQQSIPHPSSVCEVHFSPAGNDLLTTGADGSVNLWTLASLESDPVLSDPAT